MIAIHSFSVCRLIVLMSIICLAACSNGSDDNPPPVNPDGAKTNGSLSFSINWEGLSKAAGKSDKAHCQGTEISTIRAAVYDSKNKFLASQEWRCESFHGELEDISAPQTGITLYVAVKDILGSTVFMGEKDGIDVAAGKKNNAGVIDIPRFSPPVLNVSEDSVRIQWEAVDRAVEYRVVISENENLSQPTINKVCETTEYTPQELSPNTIYYVSVYARNIRGDQGVGSVPATITPSGPVAAPNGVTATGGPLKVTLNWEAAKAGDLYNIYWSTSPEVSKKNQEGRFDKIEGDTFVHEDCQADTAYYYRITAVKADGRESDFSAEVSAKAEGQPKGLENVTAEAGDRKVTLKWDAQGGFGYNIYWSTEPGVSKTNHQGKIENIEADTYVHEGLESIRHYYIVIAQSELGESQPSAEVSAAPGWIELLGGAGKQILTTSVVDDDNNVYLAGTTNQSFADITHIGEEDVVLAIYDKLGVRQWLRSYGTDKVDSVHDMGIDAAGNIYMAGLTMGVWNDGDPNPGGMIFLLKLNSTGELQWIKFPLKFTSANEEMNLPVNLSVDPDGNCYLSGDQKRTEKEKTSMDVYIVKYDTSGKQQWHKYLISEGNEAVSGLTLDEQGNVYIVGSTQGHLGGNTNPQPGVYDVYVAKYASGDGTLLWLKQLGDENIDLGFGIVATQNICMVSGVLHHIVEDKPTPDMFVARLQSDDGHLEWTQFIEDAKPATYPDAMAFAPNGNLVIAGKSRVKSIGGQANAGEPNDKGLCPFDVLVMTFDTADGERLWTNFFGSPGDDWVVPGMKVDTDGYAYISGLTDGDFGGHKNSGKIDFYSWKLHIGP